jgi:outer membrane lipopolysaccharide assembly protein LptE/RlpB
MEVADMRIPSLILIAAAAAVLLLNACSFCFDSGGRIPS